jgi:hypothetical protein
MKSYCTVCIRLKKALHGTTEYISSIFFLSSHFIRFFLSLLLFSFLLSVLSLLFGFSVEAQNGLGFVVGNVVVDGKTG